MPLQTSYTQFQPAGVVGFSANMEEWNGLTRTASATINFGAPVQRNGDKGCSPLTSGEFLGLAIGHHVLTATNADSYGQYDNVPVADEGVYWGLAGAAIAAGAALNWDSAGLKWTTAAVAGAIYAVPGAEADTAASGNNAIFKVRLRRIPS
ncbi:hypothetical protein CA235_07430 [Sphingomonas sp. ABOLF]|uniref:structural cement protein Gp24 n=1 Tax=Sphingomonas sp. ABOLF TaxID=1985879 RepID=UPI000F7E87D6|nr:capsid cement protein [Sphingomonas sp. ABOLF]RSV15675.1 hypothetical protein CA235_07430 [Sphingomonas sp. ABOLF]